MDTMEIPVASLAGKVVVTGCCVLVVAGILVWGVPKFRVFLRVVFGREPRKPETKTIHLVFGFIVYAIIFAPAVVAVLIGVGVATAAPTLISFEGIVGGNLVCNSDLSVVFFSCESPLSASSSRKMIRWDEIERVDCISRRNGTIRELIIDAGARRIEIGSLAVYDLSGAHQFILAHAPKDAAQPCHVPLGRNQ
jgi:hypothetical protein